MLDAPLPDHEGFRRQGYALAGRLSGTALETLRRVCDRLLTAPPDDDMGGKSHDIGRGQDRRFLRHAHTHDAELRALVTGPEFKAIAAHFLGADPWLFNEQFVVKGPRTGAPFAWHQDSGYVGFDHQPYLSVWVALDDTTLENGPVYLLPRDLDQQGYVEEHVWDEAAKEKVGYQGDAPGTPALVPAGGVVVFSSLTLHRSSSNSTDKPRRAYLAQFSMEPLLDPATGQPKTFALKL